MTDERNMKVSILAMLWAVSSMLKKVKGQELASSMFMEFLDTYESLQREIGFLRQQVAEQEELIIKLNRENTSFQMLGDENDALVTGNAELVATNRELRSLVESYKANWEYWQRSAKDWNKAYEDIKAGRAVG